MSAVLIRDRILYQSNKARYQILPYSMFWFILWGHEITKIAFPRPYTTIVFSDNAEKLYIFWENVNGLWLDRYLFFPKWSFRIGSHLYCYVICRKKSFPPFFLSHCSMFILRCSARALYQSLCHLISPDASYSFLEWNFYASSIARSNYDKSCLEQTCGAYQQRLSHIYMKSYNNISNAAGGLDRFKFLLVCMTDVNCKLHKVWKYKIQNSVQPLGVRNPRSANKQARVWYRRRQRRWHRATLLAVDKVEGIC